MPEHNWVALGRAVADQRTTLGLTQAEVAAVADVSASTLSNLEHGKQPATTRTLRKVEAALRVPHGWSAAILDGAPPPPPPAPAPAPAPDALADVATAASALAATLAAASAAADWLASAATAAHPPR